MDEAKNHLAIALTGPHIRNFFHNLSIYYNLICCFYEQRDPAGILQGKRNVTKLREYSTALLQGREIF